MDDEPALTWFALQSTWPGAARRSVEGEWRCAPSWPLEGAREEVRGLGSGTVPYAVQPDVGTAAWNSCAGNLPWGQPTDQRFDDAASLTWDWPADGLSLLGHPRVALRVTSSEPVAFVSVKLCDVWPNGTSSLLSRGLLNLTHRSSSTTPTPVPMGEPVDVVVQLEAMSWEAAPGHSLRLSVAGTDWPNTVAPPRPVMLTVDRSASSLGCQRPGGRSRPTSRCRCSTVTTTRRTGCRGRWRGTCSATARSALSSTARRTRRSWRPRWSGYTGRVVVDRKKFVQRADATAGFTVRWEHATVRARAELRLDAGPSTFDVQLGVETWCDGVPFASRRWTRSIERDLG